MLTMILSVNVFRHGVVKRVKMLKVAVIKTLLTKLELSTIQEIRHSIRQMLNVLGEFQYHLEKLFRLIFRSLIWKISMDQDVQIRVSFCDQLFTFFVLV